MCKRVRTPWPALAEEQLPARIEQVRNSRFYVAIRGPSRWVPSSPLPLPLPSPLLPSPVALIDLQVRTGVFTILEFCTDYTPRGASLAEEGSQGVSVFDDGGLYERYGGFMCELGYTGPLCGACEATFGRTRLCAGPAPFRPTLPAHVRLFLRVGPA